jgi:hypothetical protein
MSHPVPDWRYVSPQTIADDETIRILPPDWRGYWQYEDVLGNERDAVTIMIDWLKDQEPSVWHAFVRDYMNWDYSTPIAVWIASQPQCDRATAARLVFFNQPGFHLRHSSQLDPAVNPLTTVLQNASQGWYQAGYLYDSTDDYDDLISDWYAARQEVPVAEQTLSIDDRFIGPFEGVVANFPVSASPVTNPKMWALIERLGVDVAHCERQEFWDRYLRAYDLWELEISDIDWISKLRLRRDTLQENGPCIETESELMSYLSRDPRMKSVLLERAKQRIVKNAKR